jgi:hypothetical protein
MPVFRAEGKTLSPRTVLIPLAGFGDDAGRIARVQADSTSATRNPAGLKPQIAELADWQLYEAGAIALGAIKRLSLKPRGFAPFQRLTRTSVSGLLTVTNGPDLLGLTAENARSAELGLALALLMHASQIRDRLVIATGCLSRDAAPGIATRDVAVLPVGEMKRKIAVLEEALELQKGSAYTRRIVFFVPSVTPEGAPTTAKHAAEFQHLTDAYRQQGVEIEVCPVGTLREAAAKLQIEGTVATTADRVLVACLIAALITMGAAGLMYRWVTAPLHLAFGNIELTSGVSVASPMRAVFDIGKKTFVMRPTCFGAQRIPIYRAGESLVFRAIMRNGSLLGRGLLGYHYVVISVSEQSGLKVFPAETFRHPVSLTEHATARPLDVSWQLTAVIPVDAPGEKNKLIILARRLQPFDSAALRHDLEAALEGRPASQRINTVVAQLAGYVPGYLDYSFLSADGDVACDPS